MDHFLAVCSGWLIGHTLTEDHAIIGGKIGQWEDLLPEEELEAMKKVIMELLHQMFHYYVLRVWETSHYFYISTRIYLTIIIELCAYYNQNM